MNKVTEAINNITEEEWEGLLKTAKSKVNIGHDYIYTSHPIGVPFVAKWQVIPDPSVETMCTDGKTLRYNPEFANNLSVNANKFVILHEAGHLLFAHHLRREDRNPDLWNVAADLAMNSHFVPYIKQLGVWHELVNDIGILLPREGKFTKLPENKSTEWYYHELEMELHEPPPPPGGKPCDDGKPDDDEGKGKGDNNGDPNESEDSKGQDQDSGKGESGSSSSNSGSSSGNDSASQPSTTKSLSERLKDYLGDEGKIVGRVEDSATMCEEGADVAENEYQETVSEAVVLMKSQGHGFGNELDFLEDMLTRKAINDVSWLKRLLVQYAPGGRNHKRVNKRYSSGGIIFPKNETKGRSHGLIMVDTSGSMGNAECDEAFVQMNKIIQEFPHTKITMVQCDTDIHEESIREFSRSDLPLRVPRKWYGRGGTDMEPVLKYAKENKYKFDWAVCITDMEWDWKNCTDSGIVTKFVAVNPYRPLDINMPQRGYSYEEVYVNV
tara:strand:- start:3801 stop:5288 length:1488 start_codon:yes stop_codon:yes gene_type:complete